MPDYRDTPNYRRALAEIERRSLAMAQPGPPPDDEEDQGGEASGPDGC